MSIGLIGMLRTSAVVAMVVLMTGTVMVTLVMVMCGGGGCNVVAAAVLLLTVKVVEFVMVDGFLMVPMMYALLVYIQFVAVMVA